MRHGESDWRINHCCMAAENMVSWRRLHHATLGLLASNDLAGLCHVISAEFPVILMSKNQLNYRAETSLSAWLPPGLMSGQPLKLPPPCMIAPLFRHAKRGRYSDHGTGRTKHGLDQIARPVATPVSNCVLLLAGKHATSFQPNWGVIYWYYWRKWSV